LDKIAIDQELNIGNDAHSNHWLNALLCHLNINMIDAFITDNV